MLKFSELHITRTTKPLHPFTLSSAPPSSFLFLRSSGSRVLFRGPLSAIPPPKTIKLTPQFRDRRCPRIALVTIIAPAMVAVVRAVVRAQTPLDIVMPARYTDGSVVRQRSDHRFFWLPGTVRLVMGTLVTSSR